MSAVPTDDVVRAQRPFEGQFRERKKRVKVARPPHLPQPETELEEFFELSIDPLSIIGFDGGFRRVNASFVRVLGYSKSELFSRSALDILHPDDVEPAREALAQLAEGHEVVRFEGRVVCGDGAVRWLEWSTRTMPGRGVVYCVGRDTTERRRVEAELREVQRLLEASRDELRVHAEEQAALRRVATLVAQDVPSSELFGAVAGEVGVLLGADLGGMIRYEEGRTVTAVAKWAAAGEHPRMPEHWQIEPGDPAWLILENRAATRVEDWASVPGPFAEAVRNDFGVSSSVGCPIVVEGRLWGALAIHSTHSRPLPPDTESRMAQFTDLVGTAIANADSRGRADRLGDEQAALRRVATLVARGTGPESVFCAVADEVGALMGCDTAAIVRFEADGWATVMGAHQARRAPGARFEPDAGYVVASVRRTGHAARFDTDDPAATGMPDAVRAEGIRSGIAAPIVVDGDLWGTITVASLQRSLPASTERRLADFTELVATAISNTQAREELRRLADTQGALRRVATLVAREASQVDVFAAIADECRALFAIGESMMVRYEAGPSHVVVASTARSTEFYPVGSRHPLRGDGVTTRVFRTGRPVRVTAAGPLSEATRAAGIRCVVATPIVVAGRIWGALTMGTRGDPLPADTESRIAAFAELMATTIANTESRTRADRLADEQATLRRLATLVAHEAPLEAVFAKVAAEVARTVGNVDSALWRDDGDGTVTAVAVRGPSGVPGVGVGTRLPLDGDSVIAEVLREGRSHRVDNYSQLAGSIAERARELGMRSAVGCPIVVGSRTWGAMTVATCEAETFAAETEKRVARFSDLVATAIANAEARAEVERLAHEQAALRRVATLVAQGKPSEALFDAVCGEVEALSGADASAVIRFEADGTVTLMGAHNATRHSVGSRLEMDPDFVVAEVHRTGRAARVDTDDPAAPAPATSEVVRGERVRSAVASPIVVEGELWGAITTASRERPLLAGTERRLADFTELVATAIANTLARQQVTALAHEQAALHRVATLVAKEATLTDVFAQVAEEVARAFADVECLLFRDEGDGTATAIAVCGAGVSGRVPLGEPMPLHPAGVIPRVFREGRPSRIDDYSAVPAPLAEEAGDRGVGSAVGCPIVVGERTWGAMVVASHDAGALSPEIETRIAQFADLVATAVANADARAEVERLAEEQAALRRVATLVAVGSPPAAVFNAVAAEMERLLGADQVSLGRYEAGDEVTVVADRGTGVSRLPIGSRFHLPDQSATTMVRRTGRPARIEDFTWVEGPIAAIVRANGLRVTVGAPIVVDGALWGVITASWARKEPPPDDTEERMARFAELLDTAIANADSRDQLTASRARLVTAGDEARRRVARDLHDGAQQRLVHTIVALKLGQRALRQQDERAEALVAEALGHAEKSNEELRELAHGILPAVLTRGGLPAAVRALATRLPLPVDVDLASQRVQADVEASAYFMVAEALTNVVKHAHAERASIRTRVVDGALRVEVVDDGVGGADPTGHGLVGMADRVTALGGRLEIDSPLAGGTRTTATFQLRDET